MSTSHDTEEQQPLVTKKDSDDSSPVELTGCGASILCDPRKNVHRYLLLPLMCLLSFGSYFCYDNPAALQDTMKKDLQIDTATFSGLYSWYSWPNVILCFFGGFLIDRVFGIRMGAIIFGAFVFAGQIVFALGAYVDKLWLMNAGRFIFGIGGESLAVAQNTYAALWFKGRELNMVFGLQLSFSRVGSTVNMNTMRPLYNAVTATTPGYQGLGIALFIASSTCIFSVICAIVLGYYDWRAGKILKRAPIAAGDQVRLMDVKDFPLSLWLICIICVAYYVAIFPFISLGLVFFESKFDMDPDSANAVNSLVYIISAVASPVLGFLIDISGRNVFWVIGSIFITLGSHAILGFTFVNPYVAVIILGLAYSLLAASLWPMVAVIIPGHQLGTAYGVMQSVQNAGLGVVNILCGMIVDTRGYLVLEVFFMSCLCMALIAAVLLFIVDQSRGGGKLNRSAAQRKKDSADGE